MSNSLKSSPSLYLQQHKDSPINWYPWGVEAFQKAKEEDKLILISIGYAGCHWCHVMAKESFSDKNVADFLNKNFICIKVDCEENVEVDNFYQAVYQNMTGVSGGWPLAVYLAADKKPIFATMYLPNDGSVNQQESQLSFLDTSKKIKDQYEQNRINYDLLGNKVLESLLNLHTQKNNTDIGVDLNTTSAKKTLIEKYDQIDGGLIGPNKFPLAPTIKFMIDCWLMTIDREDTLMENAIDYLDTLSSKGLRDHIGGGFYRYCTNSDWSAPHYEKMVSDNAQLLALFSIGYNITFKNSFLREINKTAQFLITKCKINNQLFGSSLGAGSSEGEGYPYVWKVKDLVKLLSNEQIKIVEAQFNVNLNSNEEDVHLSKIVPKPMVASKLGMNIPQLLKKLSEIEELLLAYRNQLPQPILDNKCILAQNSQLAEALLLAGKYSLNADYTNSGHALLRQIKNTFYHPTQGLKSIAVGNKVYQTPNLDDLAYYLSALIVGLQHNWEFDTYELSLEIANTILEEYEDSINGGYFFGKKDGLIDVRLKTYYDRSNLNSQAKVGISLAQLYQISGDERYIKSAERCYQNAQKSGSLSSTHSLSFALLGHTLKNPPIVYLIRGNNQSEMDKWLNYALSQYHPTQLFFAIRDPIPEKLRNSIMCSEPCDKTEGYMCNNQQCHKPKTQMYELMKEIDRSNNCRAIRFAIK